MAALDTDPIDQKLSKAPKENSRRNRGRRITLGRTMLRLLVWARHRSLSNLFSWLLVAAATVCGIATYVAFSNWDDGGPDPTTVLILLNVDLLLLLVLAIVVARRLVALWIQHRSGVIGTRLHGRLVLLFGVVAMTPTILIALFATLFFTFGVQTWFGERVRTAIEQSTAVAEAYLTEHQQVIRADVLAIANDISRLRSQVAFNPDALEQLIRTQTVLRGLSEAVVFDRNQNVIAKAGYTFALQSGEPVPFVALTQADMGEVAVLTGESGDRVRALVSLDSFPGGAYLFVGRFIDPQVISRVTETQEAAEAYSRLEVSRSDLEISFTALFILVALLLLFAAIWFGLNLANRLATPIVALIKASERVRAGDLDTRVPETSANDELALLSRAFNRMTSRLAGQQQDLMAANIELDERRHFTETVLEGVSAGVIGTDAVGHITLPNRSAAELVETDLAADVGQPLAKVVPEFADLMRGLKAGTIDTSERTEVRLKRHGRRRVLMVRVSVETRDGIIVGYVFTFDDVTELQSAQRKAAWADIARRIAHEIKNPLTPIQLSAERLKRRYGPKVDDDDATFGECTDTIIRHVGDIGQMVDEFSAFARMPAPVMKTDNLANTVKQAVFLQRTAYPHMEFSCTVPSEVEEARFDARLIGQALTNILKNGIEAIEAKGTSESKGMLDITLEDQGDEFEIRVADNGIGLPETDRDRITEPYVTTREKGTGLGLAIVKKIMEDHGGVLSLDDRPEGGSIVKLTVPRGLESDARQEGGPVRELMEKAQ